MYGIVLGVTPPDALRKMNQDNVIVHDKFYYNVYEHEHDMDMIMIMYMITT